MGDSEDLRLYLEPSASRHVANALRERRDVVLQHWIQRVGQEPFHLGRLDRAVADHIPRLVDTLIAYLASFSEARARPQFVDSDLHKIAGEHGLSRLTQGLSTSEVITELRILSQEIGAELRASSTDLSLPRSELVGAELVINDVLFQAAIVASEILADAFRRQRNDAADLIVHDLRTPLTSLKGFAELLRRNPESERVAQAASMILGQTSRLTALIDGFLVGTAGTRGRDTLDRSRVDLVRLVNRVVASLGDEARRRIRVKVDSGTDTSGDWDAAQLQRVLENVLANSLKYAPTGDVVVSMSNRDDVMVLRIRDQGIGIALEDQASVLEPYYRSPDAVTRNIEGSGLGLFISRGIIEAHSGTLTVESPGRGQGTTVTIMLPRAATDQNNGSLEPTQPPLGEELEDRASN